MNHIWPKSYCTWTESEEGNWDTGCDNTFFLVEGKPSDNGMNYCPYCGGILREELYKEDE